jgi:hypothetical protein
LESNEKRSLAGSTPPGSLSLIRIVTFTLPCFGTVEIANISGTLSEMHKMYYYIKYLSYFNLNFSLKLNYRKIDDNGGKAYELGQTTVFGLQGILSCW